MPHHRRRKSAHIAFAAAAAVLSLVGIAAALSPVPTTRINFFHAGTQAGTLSYAPVGAAVCAFCHAGDEPELPYGHWTASMMGQSIRDPVFHAALSIAEQDAAFVGDSCLRCHAPAGWLQGDVLEEPGNPMNHGTNGSRLMDTDFEGVSCSICHRMVDPVYTPGSSPLLDQSILAAISPFPVNPHNGNYIVDPEDRRRGPFNLDADWMAAGSPGGFPNFHGTTPPFLQSTFHLSSRLCATCHDVSTAIYTRAMDGSYDYNGDGVAPAADKYQQFPEQRTYSEWAMSLFAQGPVNVGGRFGGLLPAVSSCQDCHMPGASGAGCAIDGAPQRPAIGGVPVPQHNFNGANSWVLNAVREVYQDSESNLAYDAAADSTERNSQMLKTASDLELSATDTLLNVRVINFSGHKLPTGYTEGRRMWINVEFFNSSDVLIAERGAYDSATGALTSSDTKVYEANLGLDADAAALTGLPAGESFHLAAVNKVYKDNRIPPMGFANAGYTAVQAGHVPANTYADGQYWDDTAYVLPPGARKAVVTVYHQTSSKEYMEFLRDTDVTPRILNLPAPRPQYLPAGTSGLLVYKIWDVLGKSAPIVMDTGMIFVGCRVDWNHDGAVTIVDIFSFLATWLATGPGADFDGSGTVAIPDIFRFLSAWFAGCP